MGKIIRVQFFFDKRNVGRLIAAELLAIFLVFYAGVSIWAPICFGALYFLFKSLNIEMHQRLVGLWIVLMLVLSSVFTAYHVQYLLLDEELRSLISDEKMWLNILCCFVVFLVVEALANRLDISCMISYLFLMLLAGINYFVYLFRGNEFIFSDIKAIRTGLSVAGMYKFVLDERAGYAILLSILYFAFVRRFRIGFVHRIPVETVLILLAVVCSIYIGRKTTNYVTETWEQKGSYRNGYILNFVLSIRDSFIREPEGHSSDAVAALEELYAGDYKSEGDCLQEVLEENPTIIVVMSESYADLSVVGDFTTNKEITPFYDSLTENIVKGYALSSVFGAKTPNSEWEFLTGNSMAFLPSGAVVYQQYMSSTPTSLVSSLRNEGYTCVAMHPYYESGWSRNLVYPDMGFEEMYFLDAFDQSQVLREYITDMELYDKIIERYESRQENEDLFIMSISMQNHGGYKNSYENFDEEIRMSEYRYSDVNRYLSLIYESDKALAHLISYFESVDGPVEIVFFGDHQPSLPTSFYKKLNGKGLSGLSMAQLEALYSVPFFIWTNYDTKEEEIEITSLNYLASLTLERSGLSMPAYNRFLLDMMEVIPAVNARGYYSVSKGRFIHLKDAKGEETEWLKSYEVLQYNNLFGGKESSEYFFPYIQEGGK